MARSREELLKSLAEYVLPIDPILAELSEYGWDAERPFFTVKWEHLLSVLSRYLHGELNADQVTDWADLVECREDIDYEPGFEEDLRNAVFELANPNLTQPVTPEAAHGIQQKFP